MKRRVFGVIALMLLCVCPMVGARVRADARPKAARPPEIDYMPTRSQERAERAREVVPAAVEPSPGKLAYQGGTVEVVPRVYVVLFGSQWKNGDPDKEIVTLAQFLRGLAGPSDTWSAVMTQYCQGAPKGALSCGSNTKHIVHPEKAPLIKIFLDVSKPAPVIPTQENFEAEAKRAAAHFGNKTAASNRNVQYIIATARGFNSDGAGTDFCAWHSYVPSKYGKLAYVNLPYVSQMGYACGAGLVNTPGVGDGITVVAGHEFIEAATDPFPDSGWLDQDAEEIADKCVWIEPGKPGGATNVALSTGSFPVQSLWSNSSGAEGSCVSSYPSAVNPSIRAVAIH